MNRLLLLFCICLLASSASAQTAYFSLEGNLNATTAQHDFLFDLSRSVDSSEVLRFETFANGGGTNAAGDTVASGGINGFLELFTAGGDPRGFNDDGAFRPGTDSLLSWVGVADSGPGILNDPLTAGSYRLNVRESTGTMGGPWAVDLVGPADAVALTGTVTVGSGTLDSLKFGTTGGGTAAFNQTAGTLDILGPLAVAPTGNAALNLTGGTIDVGGPTTVSSGGTLSINNATLSANGGVLVDGGTLEANTIGNIPLRLGLGQTFTTTNNAQTTFTGPFGINGGSMLDIQSGSDFSTTSAFDIAATGGGGDGTVVVDGDGSSLATGGPLASRWGTAGNRANITLRNRATGNIGIGSISV